MFNPLRWLQLKVYNDAINSPDRWIYCEGCNHPTDLMISRPIKLHYSDCSLISNHRFKTMFIGTYRD